MLATFGLVAFAVALVVPLVVMLASSGLFETRRNAESERNLEERTLTNFRGLPPPATVHRFSPVHDEGRLAA